MNNDISFRAIKKSDYNELSKIISDTWNYKRFCKPKTAKRMAKLYLASCLANQTFTCVAINNKIPVGIIMGKDERKHRTHMKHALFELINTFLILSDKDGRKVAKLFGNFEKMDKSLLAQSKIDFDGELAFFALRNDQRGSGIGKQLFAEFCEYMKAEKIKNFYLYTDSTCNYGFYEHQGLIRIGETNYSLKPQFDEEIQMFLYTGDLTALAY